MTTVGATFAEHTFVTYELIDEGRIARIMLNRPQQRNAQSRGLLVELDDAFIRAERDDQVRVVILGGLGPAFSAGHDLGSSVDQAERAGGESGHPTYTFNGGSRAGTEQRMLQEWHYFFDNARRWRNLKKITIAQTRGPVLAAGLMLAWTCDLIVATPTTTFADVVGSRIGMCGVEYFAHPWELGPRRAKELLLTGDTLDARTAHDWGMVSRIFKEDELDAGTLELARRVAQVPTVTSLLIKESVNQTVETWDSTTRSMLASHCTRSTMRTGARLPEASRIWGHRSSGFPTGPQRATSSLDRLMRRDELLPRLHCGRPSRLPPVNVPPPQRVSAGQQRGASGAPW